MARQSELMDPAQRVDAHRRESAALLLKIGRTWYQLS